MGQYFHQLVYLFHSSSTSKLTCFANWEEGVGLERCQERTRFG